MTPDSMGERAPVAANGPGRGTIALNLTLYQVGWFACVWGAAAGTAGWIVALALVAVHLILARETRPEIQLVAGCLAVGLLVEAVLQATGALRYGGDAASSSPLPPIWIAVLWLQFGTILHFALRWLSRRYLLAAILGLVGGPPTYLGGARIGAVTLAPSTAFPFSTLLVIGAVWALAMPLLIALADRWRPKRAAYALPWRSG